MVQHGLVHHVFRAARAVELKQGNEFFQLPVHGAWGFLFVAGGTSPSFLGVVHDAWVAEQDRASESCALTGILDDIGTERTQEMMENRLESGWLELILVHYQCRVGLHTDKSI